MAHALRAQRGDGRIAAWRCHLAGRQAQGEPEPDGRRWLQKFAGRILPLDGEAVRCYAALAAKARSAGQPLGQNDAYIAAAAQACGFAVATRDVRPFQAAGLAVINPWES